LVKKYQYLATRLVQLVHDESGQVLASGGFSVKRGRLNWITGAELQESSETLGGGVLTHMDLADHFNLFAACCCDEGQGLPPRASIGSVVGVSPVIPTALSSAAAQASACGSHLTR
jgi:hypothetical protein